MEPKFEIRLISINWIAKDKIGAIKKALAPLEMDYDPELGFSADAFSYPKIDEKTTAQISVKCFDNKIAPELAHSDGSTEQLLKVQDPITKEIYWIENGDWKSIKSSNGYKFWYMDAPSHRRAGKLNIRIGDQACLINISIPKFSADEYDEILNDFKNTCWELILDVNSGVTVEDYSETGVFSEKFYQHLTEFIRASKNILRMPHNELREKQILLKPERVRPIPRTFMELAVKGKPKTLSSRGYETSFNTPENRYIAGLAKKLSLLLYHQERISIGFSKRIKFKIKEIEKRINSYSDKFKVNPATLDFTIERERKKIEEKQKIINDIVRNNCQGIIIGKQDIIELKFKITSDPGDSYNGCSFFADIIEFESKSLSGHNYLLEFASPFKEVFKKYEVYIIRADRPEKKQFESRAGRKFEKREFEYIESIDLIDSNEHNRISQFGEWKKDLEKNNWERELSSKEKKLQEKEITNLKAQKKYFITEQQRWEQTISEMIPLSKKINDLVTSFNKLKIKPAYRFPQSVIFIYNPDYSKVKSSFDKMMKESNIEESTFESLLTIDDYEIVDLPQVYEKWCLIKIIEMLTNVYKFAGDNWKNNLIKSVKPQSNKTTEFEFTSSAIGLNLKLFYQPVLFNNKTPDYRIDVFNFDNGSSNFLSDRLASLIVDAKFKDYKDQSEILDEINLLTNIKDYGERDFLSSEMNNYVFVLHPSLNKISSPTTTQNWSISSYYGGDSLLIQNQTQPDHKFGSVLFRPGEESNLQRLLIMFFQYAVEEATKYAIADQENPQIKFDSFPKTIKKLFCPICSSSVRIESNIIGKNRNGREYILICNNKKCGTEFIINYCNNCYNRIWKLGSYWTYHDTSPLSPFDIKCPHCGISNPMNIDVRRDLN
ncbi:MAG: DUF2357 domain-containing protein [Ignavibacteriaceae bacterium]